MPIKFKKTNATYVLKDRESGWAQLNKFSRYLEVYNVYYDGVPSVCVQGSRKFGEG